MSDIQTQQDFTGHNAVTTSCCESSITSADYSLNRYYSTQHYILLLCDLTQMSIPRVDGF